MRPSGRGEVSEEVREKIVLVVDREPMVISLARVLLSKLGYRVRAVTSGLEAMRILGEGLAFEAVFWDCGLEIGVAEPADLLKRISPGTGLILLVQDESGSEPLGRGELRHVGVLQKPFSFHELVQTLAETLRTPSPKPGGTRTNFTA